MKRRKKAWTSQNTARKPTTADCYCHKKKKGLRALFSFPDFLIDAVPHFFWRPLMWRHEVFYPVSVREKSELLVVMCSGGGIFSGLHHNKAAPARNYAVAKGF
jgi:hypothetical protein